LVPQNVPNKTAQTLRTLAAADFSGAVAAVLVPGAVPGSEDLVEPVWKVLGQWENHGKTIGKP